MKPIELLQAPRLSTGASVGLLLLRVVAGLAFVLHGYGKIQNPMGWMGPDSGFPGIFQALAAIAEFGGGLAWILGLLTPLFSLGLASTMAVAVWMHAVKFGDPFVSSGPDEGAYELPAVYFFVAVLLLLAGPGKYSVDRFAFGERPK